MSSEASPPPPIITCKNMSPDAMSSKSATESNIIDKTQLEIGDQTPPITQQQQFKLPSPSSQSSALSPASPFLKSNTPPENINRLKENQSNSSAITPTTITSAAQEIITTTSIGSSSSSSSSSSASSTHSDDNMSPSDDINRRPPSQYNMKINLDKNIDAIAESLSEANNLKRSKTPIQTSSSTTATTIQHQTSIIPKQSSALLDAKFTSTFNTSATPSSSLLTTTATASAGASTTSPSSQQFCLRWNNYQSNLTSVFDELLQNESFVDVTLACDGQSIKAHKMILSACSPYFQALFFDNPCQHPIIIMRDVKYSELKAIVDFMYKGEINVSQDQIGPLLRVAEMLKIRGLADVSNEDPSADTPSPTPLLSENNNFNRSNNKLSDLTLNRSNKIKNNSTAQIHTKDFSNRETTNGNKDLATKERVCTPIVDREHEMRERDLLIREKERDRDRDRDRESPFLRKTDFEKFIPTNGPKIDFNSELTLKKARLSRDWDLASLEISLQQQQQRHQQQQHQQQQQQQQQLRQQLPVGVAHELMIESRLNAARKRPRWPSMDNSRNLESPLGILERANVGASLSERLSSERERERDRERERERERSSRPQSLGGANSDNLMERNCNRDEREIVNRSVGSNIGTGSIGAIGNRSISDLHGNSSGTCTPDNSHDISSPVASAVAAALQQQAAVAAAAAAQQQQQQQQQQIPHPPGTPQPPIPPFPLGPGGLDPVSLASIGGLGAHVDDLEIKPGIAEMIREEERVSSRFFLLSSMKYNIKLN
ncbi:protein bric-a-brac 1-like [Condylostylus longicornis]|uniref:protein bric-a-brac 1-like n=1 Tax=Condylostylus longicornis TaxID=2530218 RepID=UPI00244E28ED|nr:protein bric-a-brac 1-like [Condylostylus longicornis]